MERHKVKQEEIPQERKWQTLGNDGEMAQGIYLSKRSLGNHMRGFTLGRVGSPWKLFSEVQISRKTFQANVSAAFNSTERELTE